MDGPVLVYAVQHRPKDWKQLVNIRQFGVSEMPGCFAAAQLWGLFSCICASFSGGRTLVQSLQQKGKLSAEVAALTHYSPRYGLYVFIDVLFTQSSIFGSYFRCRNTWWVVHLFSFSSFFCTENRERHYRVKMWRDNNQKRCFFLLIGHHNKSDSPSVLNEMCWTAGFPFMSTLSLLITALKEHIHSQPTLYALYNNKYEIKFSSVLLFSLFCFALLVFFPLHKNLP